MKGMIHMTHSNMVDYIKISPHSNPRKGKITKITPHHLAGNMTMKSLGDWLHRPTTRASYNYGVNRNEVGLFVPEERRSWATSSPENDHKAITIGFANITREPHWIIHNETIDRGIKLIVDICKRNNIPELNYTGDRSGNLTKHNMFSNTNCPGPSLNGLFAEIMSSVNSHLRSENALATQGTFPIDLNLVSRLGNRGLLDLNFWINVNNIQWLNELLNNVCSSELISDVPLREIDDYCIAVQMLTSAGIINTPQYWIGLLNRPEPPKYLGGLLKNFANRLIIPEN